MINKNVNMWLAETTQGNYITIDKAVNGVDYICCECKEILHSRAITSTKISPHFYHLNNSGTNNCSCIGAIKNYWKQNLIGIGEILKIPYLNEITCNEKIIDYKINPDLKADNYIKTSAGNDILLLFEEHECNWINLSYDIYYVDVMSLKMDMSNLKYYIKLIHSKIINDSNKILRDNIKTIESKFNSNIKPGEINTNINISKFRDLQQDLLKAKYIKEHELLDNVIESIKLRNNTYQYKTYYIDKIEHDRFIKLIKSILHTTKLNIDLDLNILKRIDYNIFKDANWSKCIYFDFIKSISNLLKEHIKSIEEFSFKKL